MHARTSQVHHIRISVTNHFRRLAGQLQRIAGTEALSWALQHGDVQFLRQTPRLPVDFP